MHHDQTTRRRVLRRLLLALLAAALPRTARAQEVVAVIGSEQRPYRETYESAQAAFGKAVPVLPLGWDIPDETKVVLAFGGKAALQRYSSRVTLIYAIAPGVLVGRKTHDGPSIKIMMEPEPDALLRVLTAIQPRLKRLAVLWSGAVRAASAERLAKAGAARGVAVVSERLEDGDELPGKLRGLKGRVDAIWLPPDPMFINARNFETIKRFSYDNDVPFYAPTEGLAEQGATAGASVSFAEMGRTMAAAAKAALAGAGSPGEIYSGKVHVSINAAAAAAAALAVPAEAVKTADRVIP